MGRKKSKADDNMAPAPASEKSRSADRHKPRRTISFKPSIYRKLQELARKNRRPLNWEAEIAALNHLAANGIDVSGEEPPSA